MVKKQRTSILHIKIIRIYNHVVVLMVTITKILLQNNGRYGKCKWNKEDNE